MVDFVVGPGSGSAPPEIEEAVIGTATIGAEPVVIVTPRFRSVGVEQGGAMRDPDMWTSAVRAHGGRPLLDMDFADGEEQGWRIRIDGARIRIDGPGPMSGFADGALVCDPGWRRQVTARHRAGRGLVLVTGTPQHSGADAVLEMIGAGHALWLRARTEL